MTEVAAFHRFGVWLCSVADPVDDVEDFERGVRTAFEHVVPAFLSRGGVSVTVENPGGHRPDVVAVIIQRFTDDVDVQTHVLLKNETSDNCPVPDSRACLFQVTVELRQVGCVER